MLQKMESFISVLWDGMPVTQLTLLAQRTCERFLAGVRSHVNSQVHVHQETFPANATAKRSLLGMGAHVNGEIIVGGEQLRTQGTSDLFRLLLSRVLSHVTLGGDEKRAIDQSRIETSTLKPNLRPVPLCWERLYRSLYTGTVFRQNACACER